MNTLAEVLLNELSNVIWKTEEATMPFCLIYRYSNFQVAIHTHIHTFTYICMCTDIYKSNHSLSIVCAVIHHQQ